MEELQKRLAVQMRRAFFDKLAQDLENEDPQAAEWVGKLHEELCMRLAALRPARKDEIADKMDNGMFVRKLKAKAFRGEDMNNLLQFTYHILREIVAADMDAQLEANLKEVEREMIRPEPKFSTIVPAFLRGAHDLLDESIARIEKMRADGIVG